MQQGPPQKLSDDRVQQQLNNMRSFILQEAEDKKEEIIQRAKEEFTIEKASIFQAERLKIQKEFERREKQKEVEKKILVSNQLNSARLKVLRARDDIVLQLREESKKRLIELSNSAQYKDLLQKLIVQACLKMREPTALVRCREADKGLVNSVLEPASQEFKKLTGETVVLKIDSQYLPPAPGPDTDLAVTARYCSGGIVLSAREGKILCNNTLDQRLNLAFDAKIPEIRRVLFTVPGKQ